MIRQIPDERWESRASSSKGAEPLKSGHHPADRDEVTISAEAFHYVSELVRRETAMLYATGKEYLVDARLLPLARERGDATVDAYVERLKRDPGERDRVVDALTINETLWFRDIDPFKAFTSTILPKLLEARKSTRRLSIWSAACSSGQEPYSLAMILAEHLPPGWTVDILASDVSPAMLARAREGRYGQAEMNRGLPAAMLVKHFTHSGADWEISPHLRKMVRIRHLNLAQPFPELPTFDVVLLRNVLIYFDICTRRDVLRRTAEVTAADGYLMLGGPETTLDQDEHWVREPMGSIVVHRPVPPDMIAEPARDHSIASVALTGVDA
jgi:chemotaxis protein methyltransferase CheR